MAFYFQFHIGANFIHHQKQRDSCPQQASCAMRKQGQGGGSPALQSECHLQLAFPLITLCCLPSFAGASANPGEGRQHKSDLCDRGMWDPAHICLFFPFITGTGTGLAQEQRLRARRRRRGQGLLGGKALLGTTPTSTKNKMSEFNETLPN